jgi:uncharacterized membrane protein
VRQHIRVRLLCQCGILIALSAIGSLVKFQGSIALDSAPGYFAALYLGPEAGALVGGLGHMLTAITSGFPLTVVMHMIVALQMGIFVYLVGLIYRRINGLAAIVAAVILNGPVAALINVPISELLGLPLKGWPLFSMMIIPLTVASAVNIALAYLVLKVFPNQGDGQ